MSVSWSMNMFILVCAQNNVLELWSLFDFLMPGFLGTERQFAARYGKPILASRDAKSSSREQEAGVSALLVLIKTLHWLNSFISVWVIIFSNTTIRLQFLLGLVYWQRLILISASRCPGNGGPTSTGVALPSAENEGGCPPGPSS